METVVEEAGKLVQSYLFVRVHAGKATRVARLAPLRSNVLHLLLGAIQRISIRIREEAKLGRWLFTGWRSFRGWYYPSW
jgi:hypothetical protein